MATLGSNNITHNNDFNITVGDRPRLVTTIDGDLRIGLENTITTERTHSVFLRSSFYTGNAPLRGYYMVACNEDVTITPLAAGAGGGVNTSASAWAFGIVTSSDAGGNPSISLCGPVQGGSGAGNKTVQKGFEVFSTGGGQQCRIHRPLTSSGGGNFYGSTSSTAFGAIMEEGSNANGRFIKYADGTVIIAHNRTGISLSSSANVTFNITYPVTITLMTAFIVTAAGGNTADNNFGAYFATSRVNTGNPSIRLRHHNNTSRTDTLICSYIIYGRWY
jgi:hypothetical protein